MALILRKPLKMYSLNIFLGMLFIFTAFTSCRKEIPNEKLLTGSWQAKWTMGTDAYESSTQHMDGKFIFSKNGDVIIEAYGFDGCLFACDTLSNKLQWKLEDNVLRITDKNDASGLPYRIEKFTEKQIQLILLDDIYITLNRVCP